MYGPYGGGVSSSSPFQDVESMIRGFTQDFSTAFNTGNYDQVAALFAADGQFMAPHHEAAYGAKGIEYSLRQFAEAGYEDLRLETTRVDCSGDIAIEVGRYTVVMRQANGTIVADRGKFIHAWRRVGVWLMVADCWNSNLPPVVK